MGANSIRVAGKIDLTAALAHVEGDRRLLTELIALFLRDYPRFLGVAKSAIEKHDCSALEHEAHTFKGRLAFLGLPTVGDKAFELELMGRRGELSGAPQALAELESLMKEILPELQALAEKLQP